MRRNSGKIHAYSSISPRFFRLDERTKQDFYRRVSDHKGVDVEAAIKHLKNAQKKTGKYVKKCS